MALVVDRENSSFQNKVCTILFSLAQEDRALLLDQVNQCPLMSGSMRQKFW